MNKSLTLAIAPTGEIRYPNKTTMNLKGFFRRKTKPTINSIKFDLPDWGIHKSTNYQKIWFNNQQNTLIGVYFSDHQPSDIPVNLSDINAIRNHYRNMVVEQVDGGLIRCEIADFQGTKAIELIVKQPNETSGMTYLGSFTIPFKHCCYAVKVQAVESGITGIREALTLDKWMSKNGASEVGENGKIIGMSKDPYDENFTEGRLMNYSEKEEFDKDFPDHPLSIVRTKMVEIKTSISFTDEISKLESL